MGDTAVKTWIPTETITYIDGDQEKGIAIDWQKVRKEYNRLKIPKEYHNPTRPDFSRVGYVVDLSDRSRGKTTNKLILAFILYKMYGIVLHYIRQTKFDVERKMLVNLYSTVIDNHYIEKIFDGLYNDIYYLGKRWYLCRRGENGIEYADGKNCTFCVGLDENDGLKSTYNCPRGDMIFHDEFITSHYNYNDFVRFSDICKTIIRDRLSPVIFLSANTIDKNSPWFSELGIVEDLDRMTQGDSKTITTTFGTNIYIEILAPKVSRTREKVNARFFGFRNDKLLSITGRGAWATETYPHILPSRQDPARQIGRALYIEMSGKLVKLRVMRSEIRGICVYVTPATRTADHDIILTCGGLENQNYYFGFGLPYFRNLWKLYEQNLFYYADNSCGAFIKSYVSLTATTDRARRR